MLNAINTIQNESQLSSGFRATLIVSQRINWQIENIIGGDKQLDFSKPFLPESLARVEELAFLNQDEKRILNHIRAHAYLRIFGLVEEFILPFVLDHVRPSLDADDYRVRALLQFAGEEAKHIQLFKRFSEEFAKGFATRCEIIGPSAEIAKTVLAHQPLAVALIILHIEWMTQRHYIDSVKGNQTLDPQFKSLLRHHWMEEAQHARLDQLVVEALADGMSLEQIGKAVDEYLEIVKFLDAGLRTQTSLDLQAFERATNRRLSGDESEEFIKLQHQANRITYIGAGMTHPSFLESVEKLNPLEKLRIDNSAQAFC